MSKTPAKPSGMKPGSMHNVPASEMPMPPGHMPSGTTMPAAKKPAKPKK